jgi:hypothetical protein
MARPDWRVSCPGTPSRRVSVGAWSRRSHAHPGSVVRWTAGDMSGGQSLKRELGSMRDKTP